MDVFMVSCDSYCQTDRQIIKAHSLEEAISILRTQFNDWVEEQKMEISLIQNEQYREIRKRVVEQFQFHEPKEIFHFPNSTEEDDYNTIVNLSKLEGSILGRILHDG